MKRNHCSSSPARARRRRARFSPLVQALESRKVPTVSAFFSAVDGGVLTVVGDSLANVIFVGRSDVGTIRVNGGAVAIVGGDPPAAAVGRIQVFGQGGDDVLSLDQANGPLPAALLFGGSGDDVLFGGDGDDQLFGGWGNDTVDGGRGDDAAFLGGGDDAFTWDPGEGSDLVEGEAGRDTMAFNGSDADEAFDLSADGPRLRLLRDVGSIVMDVDGVEVVELAALGGSDTLTLSDLSATAVQELGIDLEASPGAGTADAQVDRIVLDGTDSPDGDSGDFVSVLGSPSNLFVLGLPTFVTIRQASAADELTLDGLGGDDNLSASGLAAGLVRLTLDGGSGDDQLTGSQGADVLIGGTGDDSVEGRRGDDVAVLGDGDDSFRWAPGDGNDRVEGGAGSDGMRVSGSSASETIRMEAAGDRLRVARDVDGVVLDASSIEFSSFLSFGGADTVLVADLGGAGVEVVDISLFDFGVPDGANADVVAVAGTPGDDHIAASSAKGLVEVAGLAYRVRITGTAAAGDRLEVDGRAGDDVVDASGLEPARMRFQARGGEGDDVLFGSAGGDLLFGGAGDDVVLSGAGDDEAHGEGGDDTLMGEGGDDTLDGGDGDDVLFGGDGNDTLLGGAGHDTVFGEGGDDDASLGSGDDVFVRSPSDGDDRVEGEGGNDLLRVVGTDLGESLGLSKEGGRLRIDLGAPGARADAAGIERVALDVLGGADTVTVGDLTGLGVAEIRVDLGGAPGQAGDGAGDAIVVRGSAGNDVLGGGDNFGEQVVFAKGTTLRLNGSDGPLDQLRVEGLGGDDSIDLLFLKRDSFQVVIDGGDGDDSITGTTGDDLIFGGDGRDNIRASFGDDVVFGGPGDDRLLGAAGDDYLDGGDGFDTLQGLTGDDILVNGESILDD